ncbi:MAG TPA: hypothetical protein VNX23_27120 [Bradyrhizobium sp.]|jgi:hypothetical protein|uniref:hypothetical protein n=1 Tax=Bradyrhizobium sp. TaxID=376 RepID=UPI002BECB937|nr:hypothetical protein [Bradyrhizobium sp.]HXB81032.1 hypothetical protein [Bradyrhizobium sp.]
MGPIHPTHGTQGRLDGAPLGRDDYADNEYTDEDVVSLLEENARLRKLVVKLSELVLRNVVQAK